MDASEPEEIGNKDGSECRIGIESIPDRMNHYRLGVSFLQHFYTALDYERNLIVVGLSQSGHSNGTRIIVDPEGKKENPTVPPRDNYGGLVTIFVFMIIILFTGMCCYSIAKKREEDPSYLPPILRTEAAQKF